MSESIQDILIDAGNAPGRSEQWTTAQEAEEVREKQLKNEDAKSNIELRKNLVRWMKWLVVGWLIINALFLVASMIWVGRVSDTVLCALLGTTTVEVIGLAAIVLRGMFK